MSVSRIGLGKGVVRSIYNRIAGRYDVQHSLTTAGSDQRGRRLLAAVVGDGDLVLDAGGGTGSMARLVADAVGPAGMVCTCDLSTGMLSVARRRLDEAVRSGRSTLVAGDLMAIPFPDGTFDVVLSTYSVCPLGDPDSGVLEMYRVVRPGGLLGIAHSAEPRNPVTHALGGAIEGVAWRWRGLSMGCRAVNVLPTLLEAGAELVWDRFLGVPFWPFEVFVVRKPSGERS